MDELELIVYNVGHGLAVSIVEYPEKYVTQVDLGSEGGFSPLKYLSSSRGLRADVLYITHPHADHLSDIGNVGNSSLCPNYIQYGDYDWNDVASREREELRWIIREFRKLIAYLPRREYDGAASLQWKRWKSEYAKQQFGESSYVNNSSIVIVYRWRDFKITIAGDCESRALEHLLDDDELRTYAKSTYLFVAPHHGHTSGYTAKWPAVIGKPYLSLVSIQNRDPSVAPGYYSSEFARGVTIGGRTRYCLTTRTDGTIVVKMWYKSDSSLTWSFGKE